MPCPLYVLSLAVSQPELTPATMTTASAVATR